jgi:hypothetical protein
MRINKIIGAFGNIKQIAEGVKNKIFKKADVEQIADIRWLECSICPALDVVGKTCAVPNTQPCCSDCGCSLGLKLRALSSSCPKGKWPAIVDAKSEQLIKKQIKQKENGSNI